MTSKKALFTLLILLSACGAPIQPSSQPSPKPSAPTAVKSPAPVAPVASPSASPSASPQPARAELTVELNASDLPESERQALIGQELKVLLSSKRLDGPLPEPVAVDIDNMPAVIPSSRPMPKPVYEKILSFKFGEKAVFRDLPVNEAFTLNFTAETIVKPADPESCEPSGGQVYAVASAEVTTTEGASSAVLRINSSGPYNDLVACERAVIGGQVLNEDGEPLAGAKVTLEALDKATYFDDLRETESDAEGNFRFYNLYAGHRIHITASKKGYSTQTVQTVIYTNKIGDPAVNYFTFKLKR